MLYYTPEYSNTAQLQYIPKCSQTLPDAPKYLILLQNAPKASDFSFLKKLSIAPLLADSSKSKDYFYRNSKIFQ